LVFKEDDLDEQHHIIETFTEMAPRYEGLMNNELSRFWGFTYEGFVSDFLENLHTSSADTILDIATGTAYIPSYLSRHGKPFKQIIGLDITFQMLRNSRRNITQEEIQQPFGLVCASAHEIPLKSGSIDRAICCLATHHMDLDLLLENIHQCLVPGGYAHLADVGSSSQWKIGIIRSFIKAFAFLYFIFTENYARAVAESAAIANLHTSSEWRDIIASKGFINIEIREFKSRKFWAPNPVIIKIQKSEE
jgi:ubiquinone/menaquinone biosynthesis C-methylase UbiE